MARVEFTKGVILSDSRYYAFGETTSLTGQFLKEATPYVKVLSETKVVNPRKGKTADKEVESDIEIESTEAEPETQDLVSDDTESNHQ
jgi:hypothetical protein